MERWTVVLYSIDAMVGHGGNPAAGGATVWVWAGTRAEAVAAAREAMAAETRVRTWDAAAPIFATRGWHTDPASEREDAGTGNGLKSPRHQPTTQGSA